MAIRYYLTPKVLVLGHNEPKYFMGDLGNEFPQPLIASGTWTAMDMGRAGVMLVRADVTAAEHTSIAANADVIAAPANIDGTVGTGQALNTVRNRLEAIGIPGTWIASGTNWRALIRWIGRLFAIHQRYNGRFKAAILAGITLNTTLGSLTQAQRDRLRDAAQDFGLDTTQFTGTSTIRDVLKALADANPLPIVVGGESV